MAVLTVADASEVELALREALVWQGPVYLRLERAPTPVLHLAKRPYCIGQGIVVRRGTDICIVATGSMVWEGLQAASSLEAQGVSARVVNMRSLKPIDRQLILEAASETVGIVTAEDHNCYGGLHSAVAEIVAAVGGVSLRYVAVEDCFAESGAADALRRKYRLNAAHIVDAAMALWSAGCKGGTR